jgi:hypothetical protein
MPISLTTSDRQLAAEKSSTPVRFANATRRALGLTAQSGRDQPHARARKNHDAVGI